MVFVEIFILGECWDVLDKSLLVVWYLVVCWVVKEVVIKVWFGLWFV